MTYKQSIFNPSIQDILADDVNIRDGVNYEIKDLSLQFIHGNLFPNFTRLKRAHRRVRHILDKAPRANLIAPAVSLSQAIEVAGLSELYDVSELYDYIEHEKVDGFDDQLQRIFDFTRWLENKYESLLDTGYADSANDVWNNLRISYSGGMINTRRGMLFLSFRNEYGKYRNQACFFARKTLKQRSGERITQLSFTNNALFRVPVQGQTSKNLITPYRNTTVVHAKSTVPASLSKVTVPIIKYRLLGQLVYMSKLAQQK